MLLHKSEKLKLKKNEGIKRNYVKHMKNNLFLKLVNSLSKLEKDFIKFKDRGLKK